VNPKRYGQVVRWTPVEGIEAGKPPGWDDKYQGPPLNCRSLVRHAPPMVTSDPPPWEREYIRKWVQPFVLDGFLTDYQYEAWRQAYGLYGYHLHHACGAGKTLTALLWTLSERRPHAIIVTRAPTKAQWKREVERYLKPGLKVEVLYGQTPYDIDDDANYIILSWEILSYWVDTLRRRRRYHFVGDEIHRAKAWKRSKRIILGDGTKKYEKADNTSTAAASLAKGAVKCIALTATPIRDRVMDLWSQADIVESGCWGSSWDFAHRYADAKPNPYGGLDSNGRSNLRELQLRLDVVRHVVRFAEMARSLPPKRRVLVYLDKEEQSRPTAFARDLKGAAKGGAQSLFEMRLMEAASRKRKWVVTETVNALASGQKVVIFTGRIRDCEAIHEALTKQVLKAKLETPCWIGHGKVDAKERGEMVHTYADYTGPCALVGTTDAFGEAIDGLQHTDIAIFSLLPWTPGQVTQAEGRFSRHGQTRPVQILYVIAEGTVDEHVSDVLLDKLEAVGEAVGDDDADAIARTLGGEGNDDAVINNILSRFTKKDAE